MLKSCPENCWNNTPQGFQNACKPQLFSDRLILAWWNHYENRSTNRPSVVKIKLCAEKQWNYHLWMKTSLLRKLLCLNTESLHIPGCTLHGKSASMFMLTELLYWLIKETFSVCVFITAYFHLEKPLSVGRYLFKPDSHNGSVSSLISAPSATEETFLLT